jgi:DNA-binding CsgD family transcriptional regulator
LPVYDDDSCNAVHDTERLIAAFENENEGVSGPLPDAARILAERFPELLFKFLELGGDGVIRVRPEFTTPVVRGVLAGTEIVAGQPSLMNSEITFDGSPEMRDAILSEEPTELFDPAIIRRYVESHFTHMNDAAFPDLVIQRFGITAVYLFPVRKHGAPFGVISISSPRRLISTERYVWRVVARMIGLTCIRRNLRRVLNMEMQVIASLEVPVALLDSGGDLLVASKRLHQLLDESDSLRLRQTVQRCHEAWKGRSEGTVSVPVVLGSRVSFPVEIREEDIYDPGGLPLGSILRIHPEEQATHASGLHLSERELEILRYVAEGYSIKETAAALDRSMHTIQYHRSALRRKLRPQDSSLTFQQLAASIVAGRWG